ncbi:glycosyltransferase [Pseudarthrobacter raffinosi]|uniref:glycosyltransferase n=1 Tax=Pseudarthrobacter raffinosi TaxID=2953651 RepID=UPI0035ABB076
MPVKNGGTFVRRAVVSTLRALPDSAELLVMDDGSTDTTRATLASINDPRLRLFFRNTSRGVATALNSLLEESSSDSVARMDADDVCLPWRFSLQSRVLEDHGGIAFGNVIYCTGKGVPLRPTFRRPQRAYSPNRELLDRNPFVHPTMIAQRSVIESVGGYQGVGAEDYDLWLRLATVNVPFSVVTTPVLMYRQHANQVTATKQARSELRSKWFAEELLVKSWARLADKEYGLAFHDELVSGIPRTIDEFKLRSDFAESTGRNT